MQFYGLTFKHLLGGYITDNRSKKIQQIFLNSSSPRRKVLLEQIGIDFKVASFPISEEVLKSELPLDYVVRMSKEKAKNVYIEGGLTIGADTVVCVGDRIFGKPTNISDAKRTLEVLSGIEHIVITSVAAFDGENLDYIVSQSEVQFKKLSIYEIDNYCKTEEPLDKAGSYGIQGIGGIFVKRIKGSHSGIVGLPIFETEQLLSRFNVDTWRGR